MDFPDVERVVTGLKERGYTVSLDSFDPELIFRADKAGMDLLLSVNSQNLNLARQLNCKVVVIPDFGDGLESIRSKTLRNWNDGMYPTSWILSWTRSVSASRSHCFGFTKYGGAIPKRRCSWGIGNLTELTDADSIGMNGLMAGVITELEIDYVLTTEVISWSRGAVRELDLARKLMVLGPA